MWERLTVGVVRVPLTPPSGICHRLTLASSAPVQRRRSWNGEKSKSVTKPEEERGRGRREEGEEGEEGGEWRGRREEMGRGRVNGRRGERMEEERKIHKKGRERMERVKRLQDRGYDRAKQNP